MSRYSFCYKVDGKVELYSESTAEEDALDVVDGGVATGFSGNGYLRFWTRCRRMIAELADESGVDTSLGQATILDTWYDEEKKF